MEFNRRGFSFLELVAVLSILSILVLIIVPELVPYQSYVRRSKLEQEISKVEYQAKGLILQDNLSTWRVVDEVPNVDFWTSNGRVNSLETDRLLEVPPGAINSKLEGGFYLANGNIYYTMNKLDSGEQVAPSRPNNKNPAIVDKSDLLISILSAKELKEADYKEGFEALKAILTNAEKVNSNKLATQAEVNRWQVALEVAISQLVQKQVVEWVVAGDSDFSWRFELIYGYNVPGRWLKGYYMYTGKDKYVIIPDVIRGNKMTDYRRMFEGNDTVEGVSSTNSAVVTAYHMFRNAELNKLDLSGLNVSGFKDFTALFQQAKINSLLNLDGWKTTSGIYMNNLFLDATVQEVKFGSFNIDSITDATGMFSNITTDILDLTGFNLSKSNLRTDDMFKDISVNRIYVSSQADKDEVVSSGNIDASRVFVGCPSC